MNYVIVKNGAESAYLQVYRQLREDIVSGAIPNGMRLPSKRMLAEELSVAVITVEHAYALLVDEGYAVARPRSGFFAAFGGRMPAPGAPRASLEDMSAAHDAPEDFPFSTLARTMRSVLSDCGRRILESSPGRGCLELRRALSGYLRRSRGLEVQPERLVIGSGAEYLYGLVVQLLGRERLIATEDPCYEKIRLVYEANGARCTALPLGPDGIETEALRHCRAGALHVTPFHSYPSGITATAAKRHEYAAWARERGAVLIEDDYDSELASPTRRIDTICSLAPERVIYLNSFSKILAPAMRTGYMVLPADLNAEYERRLDFYSCTVPVYDQYVLAAFLDGGHLERYINRRRRLLRKQREETEP